MFRSGWADYRAVPDVAGELLASVSFELRIRSSATPAPAPSSAPTAVPQARPRCQPPPAEAGGRCPPPSPPCPPWPARMPAAARHDRRRWRWWRWWKRLQIDALARQLAGRDRHRARRGEEAVLFHLDREAADRHARRLGQRQRARGATVDQQLGAGRSDDVQAAEVLADHVDRAVQRRQILADPGIASCWSLPRRDRSRRRPSGPAPARPGRSAPAPARSSPARTPCGTPRSAS